MEYLKKDDIILINQLTIERHGGAFIPPSNLLKEASLKYLVEAIEGSIFGKDYIQECIEKLDYICSALLATMFFMMVIRGQA